MPMYREVLLKLGPDRTKSFVLQTYRQPLRFWLAGQFYLKYMTLGSPVFDRVEKRLIRRHRATCSDGCVWAFERPAGKRVRICGYMPLTNRQDCRYYDLSHKGRGEYVERIVGPKWARRYGWSLTMIRDHTE